MGSVFQHIFDILFPPSQDELLVRDLSKKDMPSLLRPQRRENVIVLTPFQDKTIAALIHEAKFHNNILAAQLLGELLHAHLVTNHDEGFVIIPVPLSKTRQRERGYNQVSRVAHHATVGTRFQTDETVLKRTKHTTPQTELSREERLKNVRGVFEVSSSDDFSNRSIILVDDVMTTGATLREARYVLLNGGAKRVECVALAG